MSLIVASVLRSGGQYTPAHVRTLRAMVKRHLPLEHRFCVLTDQTEAFDWTGGDHGINAIPFLSDWPHWFSKINLFGSIFNAWLPDRILYFDLDTVICGDLSEMASRKEPLIVQGDTYRRPPKTQKIGYQSSIMAWDAGTLTHVYDSFAANPAEAMATVGKIGDQLWLELKAPGATFWEVTNPGQTVSYKKQCMNGRLPKDARVVDFHGKQFKPWTAPDAWCKAAYRG